MDILDGVITWSKPSDNITKDKYRNHVFRTRSICMVSMDLWKENDSIVSWPILTKKLISYYLDIKNNKLFIQLVNLQQNIQLENTFNNSKIWIIG